MNLKFRINFTVPFLVSIILGFLLVKISAESFFFVLDQYYTSAATIFRVLVSSVIVFALYKLFFKDFYVRSESPENTSIDRYYSDMVKIIIGCVIFITGFFFLPPMLTSKFVVPNLLSLLYLQFFSLYATILGLFITQFIYKWLWVHRHQKTKKHLMIFKYSLLVMIILEIPFHFVSITTDQILEMAYISTPLSLLMIFVVGLLFFTTKKNMWIQVLPRPQKLRLIALSAAGMVLSLIITVMSFQNKGEGRLTASLMVMYASGTIISWPAILSIVFFLRITFSTIASLPTTRIVERRTSEVSSLTYLNRLVAETIDFDSLIDTVTQLAFYSCDASAAWTEIYKGDGSITVSAVHNIAKEDIESLHKNFDYTELIRSVDSPLYVDSIKDYRKYYPALLGMKFAQSLIAIPLFANGERLGTLAVSQSEEYGFEADDVSVLTAFSHNVNIALENARLLEESLEKERFKQELFLAKEMEEKLLPQLLPEVKNYTLGAFSIPARIVGGDYYDIVKLRDGRFCLLIGDVSGKGVTAAFYMAQLKGVVLAVAKEATGAADLLQRINSTLFRAMEKHMYITLSALVIENDEGDITIARAGHLPLVVIKEGEFFIYTPKGIGVGLKDEKFFNSTIEDLRIKLDKHDACVLMTDGLTDMKTDSDGEFNYEYLKQIFNSEVYNNAGEIVERVKREIIRLAELDENHDDVTLFVAEYIGE